MGILCVYIASGFKILCARNCECIIEFRERKKKKNVYLFDIFGVSRCCAHVMDYNTVQTSIESIEIGTL